MPNVLSGHDLLPPSPLLRLTDVQHSGPDWIVMADGPPQAACPTCGRVSTSRHSAYVRTVKDLPAVGAIVSLQIRVSRWRCLAAACAVRFFADRLPGVAAIHGRRTCRADVVARLIGYALGGRAGERLTTRIGLPVSNDTLLRGVKQGAKPTTAATQAQVIGVDEWAKRKGRTYGTILVDLERHTVIDVLEDHSTEAVEQWLVTHPNVHTICRDRNGRYAKAARRAPPRLGRSAIGSIWCRICARPLSVNWRSTARTSACGRPRMAGRRIRRLPRSSISRSVRRSRASGDCPRAGAWPPRRKFVGNSDRRTRISSTRSRHCR
jgi:transposase